MSLFKRPSNEERFWNWFAANSDRLFSCDLHQQDVFDDLTHALARVHKDLTFEIGSEENGRREFVISAGGIREAFPTVRTLVETAPTFTKWHITAFRQPKPMGLVVEMDGARLGPDDIFFLHAADEDKIGLHLFIRGLTETSYQLIANLAFVLLDSALGEYAVETRVGFLEFDPLPDGESQCQLIPFRELPALFGITPKDSGN